MSFDNFLAITSSPKINSYLSSSISCSKYEEDVDVTPTILSICLYVTVEVELSLGLTLTRIVDVSIDEFAKTYR